MRLVFLGTSEFGLPVLRALIGSEHTVVGVITGPDKPAGRGRKISSTPVGELARQQGLQTLTPSNLRNSRFLEAFHAWEPELAVVVAFRILPAEVFDYPRYGTLNIHPSLLPRYRGPAPINWAVINGDTETGVSIIRITKRVDAGGVVMQKRYPIYADETSEDLSKRLSVEGARLLLEVIDPIQEGTISPIQQDESLVTSAPKLKKEDGLIDWNQSAEAVHNRIRGVQPWPGAYTFWKGEQLKLFRSSAVVESGEPGKILAAGNGSIVTGCGEGAVIIREIQRSGKRKMSVDDFLRGIRLSPGDRFEKPPGESI